MSRYCFFHLSVSYILLQCVINEGDSLADWHCARQQSCSVSSWCSTEMGDCLWTVCEYTGHFSMACGFVATTREEKGEFCVTVAPVTRTVGLVC